METRSEVVVVGAGLLGLATARALARAGHEVVLLEQAEVGHEASGSKGSCRIFRLGYDDAELVAMAMRARGAWTGLEDESGRRLLHPTPHLTFGEHLGGVRDAMRAAGAPHELLTEAEAAARYPAIAVGGPALLEPESCVISADATLQALAAAVPDIRSGVTVTGIADDGRQVTVRTTSGEVSARAAVVCAGPWTAALLAGSGITVPSVATLEQVGYLSTAGAPDPVLPIFICHGAPEAYGLPVPGEPLYKFGPHHSGPVIDPGSQDQAPDSELSARLTALARQYLPGLDPRLVRTERCVYDNSPDEDFIVDRVGRIVIGSGTSGTGFKFGPLLGELLAGLATGGEPDPALGRFSLSRFATAGAY
ncbi:MAG TPA: FAD-dependent oxidoreductase [Streptosporangiaceae bacterium]|nr:FAD-dependent oxidoreductase [Streptosporangiaceae bacterium]